MSRRICNRCGRKPTPKNQLRWHSSKQWLCLACQIEQLPTIATYLQRIENGLDPFTGQKEEK